MWALYAFLSAFFVATTDPIAKIALKDSDEYIVGWAILALSTPFLAAYYLAHGAVPLNKELILTLLAVLPFEIAATILYYKALKLTDISLSVPFLALTPVFVILTAFILLGESIRLAGAIGIILIAFGVWALNYKDWRYGVAHPVKAILLNRGSVCMVAVAVIFSITASVSKRAMLCSSPEAVPFMYNLSISLGMAPLVLYRMKRGYSRTAFNYKIIVSYVALGFLAALSSIFFFKALSTTAVAYAISIKRLSLVMSVFYGWLFFRERDIHIRLFSTFCMFVGVVLILIGQ